MNLRPALPGQRGAWTWTIRRSRDDSGHVANPAHMHAFALLLSPELPAVELEQASHALECRCLAQPARAPKATHQARRAGGAGCHANRSGTRAVGSKPARDLGRTSAVLFSLLNARA